MEREKQRAERNKISENISGYNIIPFLRPLMPREGTLNNYEREKEREK